MAQPSANLLDLMSSEDAEKSKRLSEARDARISELVNSEWMLLAEIGVHYGWLGIEAVLNDTITIPQANMLIKGARKLHSADVFDSAVAGVAANSKKKAAFMKIMKPFINDMKVSA